MRINTKTRYGLRAMIEIAKFDDSGGVLQKDIANNQKISYKYLDHIVRALKKANLISPVSGKRSGYILRRDPRDISLLDIHKAFDSDICIVECLADSSACKRSKSCEAQPFWKELNNELNTYFKSTNLVDFM